MKNVVVIFMALLIMGIVGIGLIGAAPKEAKLQACSVKFDEISPVFAGAESISLASAFKVKNPNKYEVTVKGLEYSLTHDGLLLGGMQIADPLYIPAEKEIRVTGVIAVVLGDTMAGLMLGGGLSKGEAIKATLKHWKVLGGKLSPPFEPDFKTYWEGLGETGTLEVKGLIFTRSPRGQELTTPFSGSLTTSLVPK